MTTQDPMSGSGTCRDVCRELDIDCWSGDLRRDFDLCNSEHFYGAARLFDRRSFDFVWIHPPYWRQKIYSEDARDLSQARTLDEFLEKYQAVIAHCMYVLRVGGTLAILMGLCGQRGYVTVVSSLQRMVVLRIHRAPHNLWPMLRVFVGGDWPSGFGNDWMFERLFVSESLREIHQNGPFLVERVAYLEYRLAQGMAISTVVDDAKRLLFAAHFFARHASKREMVCMSEVHCACRQWAKTSAGKKRASQVGFASATTRWLSFVGKMEQKSVDESPHAALIRLYADYMREERGLSPVTIEKRCWWAMKFLSLPRLRRRSLKRISIIDVDEEFQGMAERGYARSTLNTRARVLQSLFTFAERRGLCRPGLAAAIHVPRLYAGEATPRGPSWDHIMTAIQRAEGDRPVDLRESAMLMLLAFYALRSREIHQLRLDDLDCEQEQITIIDDKERRTRVYPLVRRVGDAILRYIRFARPRSSHRELFLTVRAPFRPLPACCVWNVVSKRLKSLGVPLPEYGPRAIRHSCATRLLNAEGLTLWEVGNHLGHRDPDSTQVYAKVDLANLRQIANLDLGGWL